MNTVQEFNEEILRIETAERAERINREERERLILEIAREERRNAWDAEINLHSLRGLTAGNTEEEIKATFDSMLKRVELRTYGEILRRIDEKAQREIEESRESAAEAWRDAGRRVEIERAAAKAEAWRDAGRRVEIERAAAKAEAIQIEGLKSVAKDAARDTDGTATSIAIRQAALREGSRIEAEHKKAFERETAQRRKEIEELKKVAQSSEESPEQRETALEKLAELEEEQRKTRQKEANRAADVAVGAAVAEERERERSDIENWNDVPGQAQSPTNIGGKYKNTRKSRKPKRARTVHRKRKNARTRR